MDIKDLRAKNNNELIKDLAALQEQVREVRFKLGSQEVKNVNISAGFRKDIARIKTILTERQVEAATSPSAK